MSATDSALAAESANSARTARARWTKSWTAALVAMVGGGVAGSEPVGPGRSERGVEAGVGGGTAKGATSNSCSPVIRNGIRLVTTSRRFGQAWRSSATTGPAVTCSRLSSTMSAWSRSTCAAICSSSGRSPAIHPLRAGDRRQDQRRIADRRQPVEPDAAGEARPEPGRDLDREPRFADATGNGQRQQPDLGLQEQRGDRPDLPIPADERDERQGNRRRGGLTAPGDRPKLTLVRRWRERHRTSSPPTRNHLGTTSEPTSGSWRGASPKSGAWARPRRIVGDRRGRHPGAAGPRESSPVGERSALLAGRCSPPPNPISRRR